MPKRVLPILMYHRIGSSPSGDARLWISETTFGDHLGWLARRRFRTLSLDQAFDCLRRRQVPRRAVLLTFDDAFADTLELAGAALESAGMRGAVFAPAGLLGKQVSMRRPGGGAEAASQGEIVSSAGLRHWADRGFDVGSHSLTHQDLRGLEAEVLQREAAESKRLLEQLLSRPVDDFCYPFAHHDRVARRAVAAAGYRAAYAGEPPIDDLFAIPRMMVYPYDSQTRFRRKTSGYYYWLSAWHRRLARFVRH